MAMAQVETKVEKEQREPSHERQEPIDLCAQDNPARRKGEYTLRYPLTCLGIGLRPQDTSA